MKSLLFLLATGLSVGEGQPLLPPQAVNPNEESGESAEEALWAPGVGSSEWSKEESGEQQLVAWGHQSLKEGEEEASEENPSEEGSDEAPWAPGVGSSEWSKEGSGEQQLVAWRHESLKAGEEEASEE